MDEVTSVRAAARRPRRPAGRASRWTALAAPLAVLAACTTPAPPPTTAAPATTTPTTTAPTTTVPGGGPTTSTSTTTTTTTTTTVAPGAPEIQAFTATPGSATAPALIAFGWVVDDPQGDPLTCSIDGTGDGVADVVVADCAGGGSRNVTLNASATARLTVSDGTASAQATTNVTVTTGTTETYDLVLRPVSPLDSSSQAAFAAAEARWESILVRGVSAVNVNLAAGDCLDGAAAFSGTVDDLVIDVAVVPIDGAGGTLGRAGPCLVGNLDRLARWGVMEFDSADVANLAAAGRLGDTILHEMGHVLGIGTLWDTRLSGGGTADPRYTGPRGVAAWSTFGRSGSVPVENTGGSGTRDAHWRETTFDRELMTGFLDSGAANPLSALSIASLADLGYRVDVSLADAYAPPVAGALRFLSPQHDHAADDLEDLHTTPVLPSGSV